ncbi:MAG TPA: serine/threonine-protein kinase, partial [Ignavibacteriaceae bacterium]|nr:serine/threonine-protein kinase [Ignavibacteriaceae bacterium]
MIGTNIENYKVVEVIGEGGMGVVYKALDLKLERYVAIKILNTSKPPNPQFIERFKREARNQAKLNHTNIIPVYGFTDAENTLGIVMEYIEGETLEDLIRRERRLDLRFSLDVMRQVLSGVAFAHQKGFIHRDLKPSNIIISNEGIAKIMDFGISKSINETKDITKAGTKIGTIFYMSPEQIRGKPPTTQSDLYSLGVTFYEMLSGKTPFDYPTEFEIMEAHIKKMPARLSTHL